MREASSRPVRVWGRWTSTLMAILVSSDRPLSARELAFYAGLKNSREVYPLLRYWIRRGIVIIKKVLPSIAYYTVSDTLKKAVKRALELYAHMRPYELYTKRVERIAEERLMRRLKPVERELLTLLVQLLVEGGSRYLRVRGSFIEAMNKLVDIIRRRLEKAGLSPSIIAQQLFELQESIEELSEHHIIYMHYDVKHQTLVLSIDKSIVNQLATQP